MRKKEEMLEEIREINQSLDGKYANMGTICYIILKTLELREQGLTSKDFEEQKVIFKEELE